MNADVLLGRMKLMLLGSTPSAIQATLTPAPVKPSERAVRADGSVKSVLVTCSASGSRSTAPLAPHAPGITLGVREGPLGVALGAEDGPLGVRPVPRLGDTRGRRITASGTTIATAGFALRRVTWSSETVAANEL